MKKYKRTIQMLQMSGLAQSSYREVIFLPSRKGKNSSIFLLEGVDVDTVEKRYFHHSTDDDVSSESDEEEVNNGRVTDLSWEYGRKVHMFLDVNKLKVKVWTTMIDYLSGGPLPATTDKWCCWDHHPISTTPIGLPIKYHEPGVFQTYKDSRVRIPNKLGDGEDWYFETDGIFCSFCCAQAYLDSPENMNNPLYRESHALLRFLYFKLFGKKIHNIQAASHWKSLDVYGGMLTIKKFREKFGQFVYTLTKNVRRPYMYPIGHQIEEITIF